MLFALNKNKPVSSFLHQIIFNLFQFFSSGGCIRKTIYLVDITVTECVESPQWECGGLAKLRNISTIVDFKVKTENAASVLTNIKGKKSNQNK